MTWITIWIHRFKLSQMKTHKVCGHSVPLGPKLFIGCIRINFKIEFSLTKDGNVTWIDIKYSFQVDIQSSTEEDTIVYDSESWGSIVYNMWCNGQALTKWQHIILVLKRHLHTDKICGWSLSFDHPVDMNSIFMKLCHMINMTLRSHTS